MALFIGILIGFVGYPVLTALLKKLLSLIN